MQTVAVLARVAVAVALAVAAVAKLRDRAGFEGTLALAPVTRSRAATLGRAVPIVELVLAGALVVPRLWPAGAAATAGLLGAFSAFLVTTERLDAAGGCRCFGAGSASRRRGVVRNLLLLAVLAVGAGWWVAAAAAGFAGYALAARRPRPDPAIRADRGELMLVFVEDGCRGCHDLLEGLPSWPRADGATLRVVRDADVADAYGITATPSAVVVDVAGRPVDGNHRPDPRPAVGAEAIERRWRIAVQGHDLPLDPDADRTLLLFLDRDDEVPDLQDRNVVVLTPRRLRNPPANLEVRPDPGGSIKALFDVKHTPAAVLVDRRGVPLGPVRTTATGIATWLQPPQP